MIQSIRDLLEKDKWEIKSYGEIVDALISGKGVSKSQLGTGNYPSIRYGDVHNANLFINECSHFVNPNLIRNKKCCEWGDLLAVISSENIDGSGKHVAFLQKEKAIAGENIVIIKHSQNPKYLACALSSRFCRRQAQLLSIRSIVVYLTIASLKKIKVPLPPRHVQDLIGEFLYELIQSTNELSEKLKRENGDFGSIETKF